MTANVVLLMDHECTTEILVRVYLSRTWEKVVLIVFVDTLLRTWISETFLPGLGNTILGQEREISFNQNSYASPCKYI